MTTERTRGVRPIDGERRFRMAFDAAAVGIALVDLTGRMVECNGALHDMLGFDRDELRGKSFLELTYPPDVGDDADPLADVLADRRDSCTIERRYIEQDGIAVWARLVASIVRDAGWHARYGVAFLADITDHKALEEQFLHAQKLATIGQLAGSIAQDFNNLLTVIRGYSEFILEQTDADDVRHGHADEIRRSAHEASLLTQQLLSHTRQRTRHAQLVDVKQTIRDLERMLRRVIGEDVALAIQFGDDPSTVFIDADHLRHVVLNLVVDAREAMPAGGALLIETGVEIVPPDIGGHVDGAPFGRRHVRVSVTDTGCGVPHAIQHQIFEPFFTTKEPADGAGLGLSTVYRIVNDAGGIVRLPADPCRNTTFDVLLPAINVAVDDDETPTSAPEPRPEAETILLVEDDRAVRRVAERTLADRGYRVLVAGSGEEAMEIASTFADRIHAVVTDVVMPGMTGPTLVARLELTRPDIRVLYVSGHAASMLARLGVDEEETDVLRKPFSPDELAWRVKQTVS